MRNEKARRFLMNMRKKPGVKFDQYFPKADKGALRLLKLMLSFDPAERPTSEDALADPYFAGLSQPGREPSAQPVSKMAFEFERRKLGSNEVRALSPPVSQLFASQDTGAATGHFAASLSPTFLSVLISIASYSSRYQHRWREHGVIDYTDQARQLAGGDVPDLLYTLCRCGS